MKNQNLLVSCLLAVLCFAGVASGQGPGGMRPPERPKDPEYTKLMDKLKGGNTEIDYKALRMAWARSGFAGSRGLDPKFRASMVEAVKANKYDEIVKNANEILKVNLMDINTHVIAAAAYLELKDAKKADYHQAVYLGLINSIVNGSDGESPKTAYMVVSRDEIIAVLRAYELQATASEEMTEGTSNYQIVTATDKANGGISKVYFNIDMMPKMPERPAGPAKQ